MKQQTKLFKLVVAAVCLSGLATLSSAAEAGPFQVQASLLTPAKISLGEPILIRYQITNATTQSILTHLGIYGTDWYSLSLRDAKGSPVAAVAALQSAPSQGAHSTKSGFFHGGTSDTDYILVTKCFAITQPGRYSVTLRAKLPYIIGGTLTEGTPETLAISSEQVQAEDISFSILITPTSATNLRSTAEALRVASTDGQDGLLARAKTDALFSMPAAQAAPSWRALALTPSMSSDLVANELVELNTPTSVDILNEMLNVPNLNCTPISDRLNKMYNAASPTLREHIKAVARQRGFEMPEVAGVPAAMQDPDPHVGVAF